MGEDIIATPEFLRSIVTGKVKLKPCKNRPNEYWVKYDTICVNYAQEKVTFSYRGQDSGSVALFKTKGAALGSLTLTGLRGRYNFKLK